MKNRSETLLLDTNVLLALAWPSHQFHAAAPRRLQVAEQRWSTCALTQLGFIRLSSNPAAVPAAVAPSAAAALLAEMVRDPLHLYLERLPSPTWKDFPRPPARRPPSPRRGATNRPRAWTCLPSRGVTRLDFWRSTRAFAFSRMWSWSPKRGSPLDDPSKETIVG